MLPGRNADDGCPHRLHHCDDGSGVGVKKFNVRPSCGADLTPPWTASFVLFAIDQLQDFLNVLLHLAPPFLSN
jgi:hypothetical protein